MALSSSQAKQVDASPSASGQTRLMRLAIPAAVLLVVAGGLAFTYASRRAGTVGLDGAVVVTIGDRTCSPDDLSVPAGPTTFRIVNASNRALEWEILDGVMVKAERENIAPGIALTFTTALPAGTYQITCGLLNNPRGVLHVTPSAAADAAARRPGLVAFLGPLSEYRVFLAMQVGDLVKAVQDLDAAIRGGDLGKARLAYAPARAPYARIEPVARRFTDLGNAIDPTAAYLQDREADPAFTGFHRIEYGLFSKNSLEGLAPVSARLLADITALKDRLRGARLSPDEIVDGAGQLAAVLAQTRIETGGNLYSGGDLADFDANVEGIAKVMTLMKPVAIKAAPEDVAAIEARLAAARAALARLKGPDGGYPPYGAVGPESRKALSKEMQSLADAIGRFNAAVGLG